MNDELLVVGDEAPKGDGLMPLESAPEMSDDDVKKLARPNCRHCQGRGIAGFNISGGKREEILCSCVVNRVERLERMVEQKEKLLLENRA